MDPAETAEGTVRGIRMLAAALIALWAMGTAAAAETWRVTDLVRFPDEVHVLVPTPAGLLAAGPGTDGRAWWALLDPATLAVGRRTSIDCLRCDFRDGAALGDGRVVLVGSWQEATTVPARGWVVVLDPRRGRRLAEATVGGGGPVRFHAVDTGFGRVLAVGEAGPAMGADAVGVAAVFRADGLVLEGEWPFEDVRPRSAQVARILGAEDFLAGGWSFEAAGAGLGGWLARFGFKGEPFWQRRFGDGDGFEPVAVFPAGEVLRLVGHAGLLTDRGVRFHPVFATVRREDGTVLAVEGPFDGVDRMVGAGLALEDGAVLLAVARDDGEGERGELLVHRPGGRPQPVADLGDRGRPTVPVRLARDGDGVLYLAGWFRGEDPPRGWVARLVPAAEAATERALTEPLRLGLVCAGAGRVRVVLENRGATPARVRPLTTTTVRLMPAAEAPRPGLVGAMPGRAPDPLAEGDRVTLAPGAALTVELPVPAGAGVLRAVYSPDFAGHGLGRLLVSAPLRPGEEGCPRESTRGSRRSPD